MFGLRLGVGDPAVSRYEKGGIPKRAILAALLQLAVTPEEKNPILAAMGLDESMRAVGGDAAHVKEFDIYEQAKTIEANEPRRPWKRGSLIDFAEKATVIVREVRDVDPALVAILDGWIKYHDEARAQDDFRDISADLWERLSIYANERVAAQVVKPRKRK